MFKQQNMFNIPKKLLKLILQHSALLSCWSASSFFEFCFLTIKEYIVGFQKYLFWFAYLVLLHCTFLCNVVCLSICHNTLDNKQKCVLERKWKKLLKYMYTYLHTVYISIFIDTYVYINRYILKVIRVLD